VTLTQTINSFIAIIGFKLQSGELMKTVIPILALSISFIGCNQLTYEGPIRIEKDFQVYTKKGEPLLVQKGTTQIKLKVGKSDFELEFPQIRKHHNRIKSDLRYSIISNGLDDQLKIPGKEIGQDFDIDGTIKSTVVKSDLIREKEDCSEMELIGRVPINRSGERNVTYYWLKTTTHRQFRLLEPNQNVELAKAEDQQTSEKKQYDSYGDCDTF
jgi:hypothetical protein